MCIPVGRWAEGGRGKSQEAKTGELLHVEKKTGGSVRALLLARAGGWGPVRVPVTLLGQNITKGSDVDTPSLREDLTLSKLMVIIKIMLFCRTKYTSMIYFNRTMF